MEQSSDDIPIVDCPHCKDPVIITRINCAIFRHGQWKHNGQQLPPHSSKQLCDIAFATGKIYGCGKPFRVKKDDEGKLIAEVCDYI